MTKNTSTFLLLAALLSSLFFSSCSSKPSSLSAIPETAQLVVSVDLKSLYSKGELSDMQDLEIIKLLKDDLKNEDQKLQDFMQGLMDDPESSGVNMRKEMFIYIVNDGRENHYTCISMDLNSANDFENFLSELNSLDRGNAAFEPTVKDNYKYNIQGNDMALGWDESKMVITIPFNYRSSDNLEFGIKKMFSVPEDRTITEVSSFNSFLEDTKDINLWMSTEIFVGEREFAMIEKDLGFSLKGNYLVGHLDFDEDQIIVDLKTIFSEEMQKNMGAYMTSSGIDDDLMEYLPQENFVVAGMRVDIDAVSENISEREGYEEMSREIEREMGYTMEELLGAFGGDIAMNIFDFKLGEYGSTNPVFAGVLNIEDEDIILQLMKKAEQEGVQKKNGYFLFPIDYQNSAFLAMNNEIMMITNDETTMTKFLDGGMDENLNDDNVSDNLEDHGMYSRIKLNARDYPQSMQTMFNDMRGDEKAMFELWNEEVENMEFFMDDNTHYTLKLNLTEKDENSLFRIIQMIDKNFAKFM